MKKKRFLVALAVVAILIPLLVGCDAFGTGATPPATSGVPASIPQLEGRMSSLESRVSSVEGKITDTSTLQTDLEQLRTDFDAFVVLATEEGGTTTELAATIAELNDRISAIEKQFDEEEENGATTEEIAKWYKDICCLNHYETENSQVDGESDVVIKSLRFSPSKIQEADDYTVSFEIYNNTLGEIGNLQIEITLRPRTGSRVVVDEDEVYLDTTASPFYYWDTDVVTRGDGTCRRIAFLSSPEIRLDAGEVEGEVFKPSMTVLRLVFTLAYE